jgi:foldase protein PrsA
VLTKTKAKAEQARAALSDGDSFKAVAKKYSIDEASKDQGGQLLGVAEGQQEAALDKAVFAADKGELQGPVKTQFGYYVFQVSKVTPAKQGTLAESKQTIQQLLAAENQQKALDTFVKDFRKRWKERRSAARATWSATRARAQAHAAGGHARPAGAGRAAAARRGLGALARPGGRRDDAPPG